MPQKSTIRAFSRAHTSPTDLDLWSWPSRILSPCPLWPRVWLTKFGDSQTLIGAMKLFINICNYIPLIIFGGGGNNGMGLRQPCCTLVSVTLCCPTQKYSPPMMQLFCQYSWTTCYHCMVDGQSVCTSQKWYRSAQPPEELKRSHSDDQQI